MYREGTHILVGGVGNELTEFVFCTKTTAQANVSSLFGGVLANADGGNDFLFAHGGSKNGLTVGQGEGVFVTGRQTKGHNGGGRVIAIRHSLDAPEVLILTKEVVAFHGAVGSGQQNVTTSKGVKVQGVHGKASFPGGFGKSVRDS